jgi:hypothetical protein
MLKTSEEEFFSLAFGILLAALGNVSLFQKAVAI